MKVITIKNSDGDTIDIKRGADGRIRIRHSGLAPKYFGQLKEARHILKDPEVGLKMKERMDAIAAKEGLALDGQEYKALVQKVTDDVAYMWLHNQDYPIRGEDLALIRGAIAKLG